MHRAHEPGRALPTDPNTDSLYDAFTEWTARQGLSLRAPETNYLRVYIAQLGRKLEAEPSHPRHLLTEPGIGYRFARG